MLINKRAALRGMALEASFVLAEKSKAAAFQRLLHIGAAAFDRHPYMRIMAISTTDLAFQYRMVVRQLELCPHLEMTLKTCFR